MDILAYTLAKNKANDYTDLKVDLLSKGLTYKGKKQTYNDLPTSGNTLGDVWSISSGEYQGQMFVWPLEATSGSLSDWESLTVSIANYLKSISADASGTTFTIKMVVNGTEQAFVIDLSVYRKAAAQDEIDNQIKSDLDKEIADRATAITSVTEKIDTETSRATDAEAALQTALNQAISKITTEVNNIYAAINSEASTRETADNNLQSEIETEAKTREAETAALQTSLETEQTNREAADTQLQKNIDTKVTANSKTNIVYGNDGNGTATTFPINVDANSYTVAYRDGTGGLNVKDPTLDTHATTKSYVDTIASEAKTEIENLYKTKQDTLTAGENITIENNIISAKDTQAYYIELTGTGGTLSEEDRKTLLSGSPTINFIDKDGMLFKCVFYKNTDSEKRAVYAIPGEAKNHCIEVTLSTGAWVLTTYEMLTTDKVKAGDNIEITEKDGNITISSTGGGEPSEYLKTITKTEDGVVTITDKEGNETTFQTGGGSGGGVSQTYVDQQDQAILTTATERIDAEGKARAEADDTLTESIKTENTRATNKESELEGKIDGKQNALEAGDNITLSENEETGKTTISATDTKPSYISLSGTSGTLTTEQRQTLLSGSPTINFIDKDNMIFKCIFYSAGKKAVYGIPGESKNHCIEITLDGGTSDGKWVLTTYSMATATDLSNEVTRAETAEANLQTTINDEATRAQTAESELSGQILSKQDNLTPGTNITIEEIEGKTVISASGEPEAYIKKLESSGNTLTWTNKDDTTGSFTPAGEGGITDVSVNDESIVTEQKAYLKTDKKSILFENGEIKLPDDWISYLEAQTYKAPVATIYGQNKSVEYGETITESNAFSHSETNVSNITGDMNLLKNGTSVASFQPNTDKTTISYEFSQVMTSNVTFKIQGTNSKENKFESSTITYSCYKPVWYGASAKDTLTSEDLSSLTKKTSSTFGTITFTTELNDYGYMLTNGTITKVTSGGFEVPVTKAQTINIDFNGNTLSYNVYRTDKLAAGENTFTVS